MKEIVNSLFKYSVVGVIGTLVDISVLFILVEYLSLGILDSTVIAFLFAATHNFILNKFWTFENRDHRYRLQYIKFILVSAVGFVLTVTWMWFFVSVIGIWYLQAKILTSIIVLLWNFLGNRMWTFKDIVDVNFETPSNLPYEISIVIPCYNEEKRIKNTLRQISAFFSSQKMKYEILVVNDGSKDYTSDVVNNHSRNVDGNTKCIDLKKNRGKGYATKVGLSHAQGNMILYTDADNAAPISEVLKLIPHLDSSDIVIGSRNMNDSVKEGQPFLRIIMSYISGLMSGVLVKDISDTQCGFKLFKHDVAKVLAHKQTIDRFAFDVELLAIAQLKEKKIIEVPVVWNHVGGSNIRPVIDSFRYMYDFLMIRWNLFLQKY